MDTSTVEKGLADWLDELLEEIMVFPAASATPLPDHEVCVLVRCADVPHEVGTLYYGELELIARVPRGVEGLTEADLRELAELVQEQMVPDNMEALDDALQAAAGAKQNGWYYRGSVPDHEAGAWRSVMRYTLGLETT